jgi:anti-sigma factor RsiW
MTQAVSPECGAVLSGISAYLDGELEATACDAIERHCLTCPSCATFVEGLRETIGLCRGAALAPIPTEVRAKAQASIAALLKAGRRST